MQFSGSL